MLTYTNDERQIILSKIREVLELKPQLKPSKGLHNLIKAEWLGLAKQLEIDIDNLGSISGNRTIQPKIKANVSIEPIGKADFKISDINKKVNGVLNLPLMQLKKELEGLIQFKDNPPITIQEKIVKVNNGSVAEIMPVTEIIQVDKIGSETGSKLFGFKSFSNVSFDIFNDKRSPDVDDNYIPNKDVLEMFLSCASPKNGQNPENIFLYGKAGTGKTSLPRWFSAKTGRQFMAITGNDDITVDQFFGSMGAKNGSTFWQDGLLLRAVRQPQTVLLIDEITRIRPDVLSGLNGALQDREFVIPETGERVPFAEGVVIVACDNTNGQGDVTGQFAGTKQMDSSLSNRFAVFLEVSYPKPSIESRILRNKTGCGQRLADKIVEFVNLCRNANTTGDAPTLAPSLRNTVSWVNRLTYGIDPKISLMACMGNQLDTEDREFLSQLYNTHIDPETFKILVVDGELPTIVETIEDVVNQELEEPINTEDNKDMPY